MPAAALDSLSGLSYDPDELNKEPIIMQDTMIFDRHSEVFASRSEFEQSLGAALIRKATEIPDKDVIIDRSNGRNVMNMATFLAISSLIAPLLKEIPEQRIGIVLPPGTGGWVANAACVLAGKTPVNINYSLGRTLVSACIAKSGVSTLISAAAMQEAVNHKTPGFPWPETVLDIGALIQSLSREHLAERIRDIHTTPADTLISRWQVDPQGGDRELSLLFTSGSEDNPKGVIFSHRNILCNCQQVWDCGILHKDGILLANLPIFHSFGFSTAMWLMLLTGYTTVTLPNPMEYQRAAEVIAEEQVTILIGSYTLFRPYLKKASPEQLSSLRCVVAGTEKTPEGFHEQWNQRFPGCLYLEGYGLTETSPVACVNLPREFTVENGRTVYGIRPGSSGQLYNGMAVQVMDPDTEQLLPVSQTGVLMFRGGNILSRYLDDKDNKAAFRGDWFVSGDLGHIDEDGFLYIDGRQSRFSKIGGEMVSHGRLETLISSEMGLDHSEKHLIAISARPDKNRGEELILVTATDISLEEVREKLHKAGVANLWIPRRMCRTEEIPTHPSGKMDLKLLREIAAQA